MPADAARTEPSKGKKLLNLLKGKDKGEAEGLEPAAAVVCFCCCCGTLGREHDQGSSAPRGAQQLLLLANTNPCAVHKICVTFTNGRLYLARL